MKRLPVFFALLLLLPGARAYANDTAISALVGEAQVEISQAPAELLIYALSMDGIPYKYGGNTPEGGFDCSGFVRHVFQAGAGYVLPRNAESMSTLGRKIPVAELRPGDLVFFNTLRRPFSHVGIFLGDGRFIHASSSTTGSVMISDMRDRYWSKRFDGARRLPLPAGLEPLPEE